MVSVGRDGRRLGVWVDHRRALVIDVSGLRGGEMPARVERIESEVQPLSGRARSRGRGAAPTVISLEERRELIRRRQQLAAFYATVAEAAAGAERVLVMGPGLASAELYDLLENDRRFLGSLEPFERTDPRLGLDEVVDLARERVGRRDVRARAGTPNF